MKRAPLAGLVAIVGTGLLLFGCSSSNGTSPAQPAVQPALVSSQPPAESPSTSGQALAQPTPTSPGSSLDQSAAEVDQALSDLQNAVQAEDVSTPSSTEDQSLPDADQSLDGLQQSIQTEPAP